MDIIVTTPKSRIAEAAAEAAEAIAAGGEYFRRFPCGAPPPVWPDERVYYVEDGYIRGFAVVSRTGVVSKGRECGATGRRYGPGYYVVMAADSWQWIRPIPMTGFQGFRYASKYFTPDDIEIVGGWLDPQPSTAAAHSAIGDRQSAIEMTEADLGRGDDASRTGLPSDRLDGGKLPAVKSPARSVSIGQGNMRNGLVTAERRAVAGKESENDYRREREDRRATGFAGR